MRKLLFFLMFLLIIPSAFAIKVNPSSLYEKTQPNIYFKRYFNVTNDGNSTLTLYISKQGIVADWCTLEPSVLTLDPNQTKSFYCLFIIPNTQGIFQGALLLDSTTIPITIEVSNITQVEEETGVFDFLTTSYGVSIQQGYKFVKSFYLRNDMNVRVEVKDFNFIGTGYIVTPEGGKPVRIEAWELGYLEPGEEKVIDVTIDGNLPVGTYKVVLEVIGLTPSKKKVVADLSFTINIVEEASPIPTLKLTCPEEVYEGDAFSIYLENIKPDTKIFYSMPFAGKETRTSTRWQFDCPGTSSGTYNITLLILQEDSLITKECVINVKKKPTPKILIVEYRIENDTLYLTAKDQYSGEVLEDAVIKVDGATYEEPIKVTPGKTYLITASCSGYEPFSREIRVPLKMMTCTYEPKEPKTTDKIIITCSVEDAKIYVDNQLYTEPIKLKAGTHRILAQREGYRDVELTFNVKGVSLFPKLNLSDLWYIVIPALLIIGLIYFKWFRKPKERVEVKYYPKLTGPLEKVRGKREEEEE